MDRHERATTSEEQAEKRRAYKREWQRKDRLKNPEKYRAYGKKAQQSDKRKAYKAEWQRKWREENREEAREISREASAKHREANREQTIAATKKWQAEHPEQALASQRAWIAANPDKPAEYRKAHAAARKADDIARRAKRDKATPAWADIDAMQAFYDKRDALTAETGIQHHVDHIYPLRGKLVSGLHNQFNLRVVTADENLRKGNKLVDDIV